MRSDAFSESIQDSSGQTISWSTWQAPHEVSAWELMSIVLTSGSKTAWQTPDEPNRGLWSQFES